MSLVTLVGLAFAFTACSTLGKPSDMLVLPNLVDLALIQGDKIIDCSPPDNPMLGGDSSHTCVKIISKDVGSEQAQFEKYLTHLETSEWNYQGEEYSHNNPLEPAHKYLYFTKEFPELGGKRELFILPKSTEDTKNLLLIFEATDSVIGNPDCDEQNEHNR